MAANFEIETKRINVGKNGGFFTVRGVNAEDFVFLTTNYLTDLRLAVAKQAERGKSSKTAVADLIMDIVKDFPMMTVEIISRAAEATDAESVEKFRRLAIVKQIEALKEIFLLSVEDGGIDLKKALGVVVNALEANGVNPGPLMNSLTTIIETSGKPSPT